MAAITVTASSVLPNSSTNNVFITQFNAGVTLTAGLSVYLDTSNLWQLTDANLSVTAAGSRGKVGITVSGASANCPIAVQTEGELNPGGTMTAGKTYVAGASTAGDIAPISDNASGWYTTILGVATTSTNLRMPPGGPWASGAVT